MLSRQGMKYYPQTNFHCTGNFGATNWGRRILAASQPLPTLHMYTFISLVRRAYLPAVSVGLSMIDLDIHDKFRDFFHRSLPQVFHFFSYMLAHPWIKIQTYLPSSSLSRPGCLPVVVPPSSLTKLVTYRMCLYVRMFVCHAAVDFFLALPALLWLAV